MICPVHRIKMEPPTAVRISPANPLRRRGAVCLACLAEAKERIAEQRGHVQSLRKSFRTFGRIHRTRQIEPHTVMMPRD